MANSTSSTGILKRGGYVSVQVDVRSLRKIEEMLNLVPVKMREKIAKKAMREWGKRVKKAAQKYAYKWAERTKKQLFVKVRKYKTCVWAGVGVKTDNPKKKPAVGMGRHSPFVGWKSHLMEFGWHAWPKGLSGNAERGKIILRNKRIDAGEGAVRIDQYIGKDGKVHKITRREKKISISNEESHVGKRGWKKGLRGHRGRYLARYATRYMHKASVVGKGIAYDIIAKSVAESIREARRAA